MTSCARRDLNGALSGNLSRILLTADMYGMVVPGVRGVLSWITRAAGAAARQLE